MDVYCEGATDIRHDRVEVEAVTTEFGGLTYTCTVCNQNAQIGHASVNIVDRFLQSQPLLRDGVSVHVLNVMISRFKGQIAALTVPELDE